MKSVLSLVFALLVSAGWSLAAEKPNIVIILADDLGIGDVNCYGGERCLIETPNLDRLAAEGVRFTNAYANASTCTPTRRALMTGRYSWRYGPSIGSGPWGFVGPCEGLEKFTIGKLLKQTGYDTGYVGKWHLGTKMTRFDESEVQGPGNVDFTRPILFGPEQFGFDESFILPGSLDMFPYVFARNHEWQGEVTAEKGWSAFNRVGPSEKDFEDHEVLETFYQEAEAYLASRSDGTPFFLFLSLTAPHTPTSPGVAWQGKSDLGVYGDFVMEVDHAVERVLKVLEEKGLDENTLVMFSSDHGPAPYAGNILAATPNQIEELENRGHHSNGVHRGYKFSIYEGGFRVPLLARWPKGAAAGADCEAIVGLGDMMATLADLTGQELSEEQGPDSISFASLLKEPESAGERGDIILASGGRFTIREGNWKLCLTPGSGVKADSENAAGNDPMPDVAWRAAIDAFGKVPTEADLFKSPFVQLFDVTHDPHEDNNLAAQHPERVDSMVALLISQVERGRSTPGPDLSNDNRVRIVNLRDKRLPEFVRKMVDSR
ncbi:MAG: arylsulfatase [Verrucomicrobiota bacterium]